MDLHPARIPPSNPCLKPDAQLISLDFDLEKFLQLSYMGQWTAQY